MAEKEKLVVDRAVASTKLHAVKGKLSSHDGDGFDKFRSSLLAFGGVRTFKENKDYIKKILSYKKSLQKEMLSFFESIDLADRFKEVLLIAKNALRTSVKSSIPSLLTDVILFPYGPFISESFFKGHNGNYVKNIEAYIYSFELKQQTKNDIVSTLKRIYATWKDCTNDTERVCVMKLTIDTKEDIEILDYVIRNFRRGRNYNALFKNIYFVLNCDERQEFFTLDDYCEKDGFKKKNQEKTNKRLSQYALKVKVKK